jgi:2-polyprenyl-6-methoxyphenol hydroxylase-like FAD-dependent oxidoreductase
MPDPEVIVVGAGPAGATLAARLGDRGRAVLLLDRARFPRDAVCGEAVSPGARALLDGLGVTDAVLAAGAYPYRGVRLVASDGAIAESRYPAGHAGLSLPRLVLDDLLLARARRSPGVVVREGATVVEVLREGDACAGVRLADGATLRARVVVAADGRRSRGGTRGLGGGAPPPARRGW